MIPLSQYTTEELQDELDKRRQLQIADAKQTYDELIELAAQIKRQEIK